MKKIRLFTPGPCAVPEEVLLEMSRPFHHHRTDWFKGLMKECTEKLQRVLCTKNDVIIVTGSGTAAAEGAIVGCCGAGSKLLTIEAGKFGQRWGEIAEQFGIPVTRHAVAWGDALAPAQLRELLSADRAITAVMVVHSETSTGTRCDLEGIAQVCKSSGKLLLADCITSAGAIPLLPDAWGVDVVITGSQKSLMMPPGLGVVSVSGQAWSAIEANKARPSFYLDLARARKSAAEHDTPFTPAHLLVRGLNKALDLILDEGLENVWRRIAAMAAATRAAGEAIGLPVFSRLPSDSVTALRPPAGITVKDIRNDLEARFGIESAGGQDQLKGKVFRLGHMGYIDELDAVLAVAALEQVLHQRGHKFELGAGVTAAQRVLSERLR